MDEFISVNKMQLISTKKIYTIYGFFSICILGIVIYLINVLYQYDLNSLKTTLNNYSEVTEASLESSLEQILNALEYIQYEVHETDNIQKAFNYNKILAYKAPLNEIPSIELRIANTHGEIIISTTPTNLNVYDRSYFQAFLKDSTLETYFSEPIKGKIRNGWVIVFAKKLTAKNGNFLGVAWASFDTNYFASFRNNLNLGEESLFVVGSGKKPLFAYRYPEIKDVIGSEFKTYPNADPVFRDKLHRGVYEVYSLKDKVHRYISVSWVKKYPLIVAIGKDFNSYLATWYLQSVILFLLTTITLLLGLFFIRLYLKNEKESYQFQSQLTNSAKLVALGEMSSSIAHEINNPLTIILMNLKKLEKIINDVSISNEDKLNIISKAITNTDRISKIINGLKIVSRQQNNYKRNIQFSQVLDEVIGICSEKFKSNGMEIYIENSAPESIVFADETQIMQVMLNLLNNSFDAINFLENKWLKIKIQKSSGFLVVEIIDSGHGIPKELQTRMLEPFFTTKEIGKGTGLGLSISKGIIEDHSGKFWFEPHSNNTTFVIELPLIDNPVK